MSNVYVTGASGFVGAYLCKKLIEDGHNVIGLIRDLKKESTLNDLGIINKMEIVIGNVCNKELHRRVFSDYNIDTVYHLAAQAIVSTAIKNPYDTFKVNCLGTVALLDACKEFNAKAILIVSTDKIYGEGTNKKEDDGFNAFGIYDCSKVTEEFAARSFYYAYNMPIVISRACNIYGAYDHNARIIPNTIRKLKAGERPIIFRGVEGLREYIHVEDAVEAYISLVDNIEATKGDVFNIGSEESLNQEDMVNTIIKISKTGIVPVYKTKESIGEIDSQTLDCAKIKKILGWKAKHTILEGLKKTWEMEK